MLHMDRQMLIKLNRDTADANSCIPIQQLQETVPYLHRTSAPVSVIIVNWNAGDLLERCVSSLLAQTVLPHEIIMFDNASTDGSVKQINDKFPSVRVIESKRNLGFAAANNLAIQEASAITEWLVFLNPDAFPERGWLGALWNAATAIPECAIFGSRLMDASSTAIVDGIGDVYHASGRVWRAGHGMLLGSCDRVAREIFSPCAAAAMFRKDAFLAAGGFDEDFFCYVEDVDLGFRMRLLGHRCWYVPDSVALHVGSAVTGRRSDFSIYHAHRNLVWAYIKNMPGFLFWLFLPLHLALNLFSIVYFSLKGQARVIARAKWDALKGIPKMGRKRREIQSGRVVSVREIWRMLDKRLIPMRRA
jgi:GT2 family glycosyltransferase